MLLDQDVDEFPVICPDSEDDEFPRLEKRRSSLTSSQPFIAETPPSKQWKSQIIPETPLDQWLSRNTYASPVLTGPSVDPLIDEFNAATLEEMDEAQRVQITTEILAEPEILPDLIPLGFPECIRRRFSASGVKELHSWQTECLRQHKETVLDGCQSLLIVAPTSAGKSLVSQLLLIRRLLDNAPACMVLIIVPYVAMVHEQSRQWKKLLTGGTLKFPHRKLFRRGSDGRLEVRAFYANGGDPHESILTADIAIATIEKASSLIQFLLAEQRHERVGAVLVDEVHSVLDGRRGALLHCCLSKLMFHLPRLQVIGMSATLPQLQLLKHWLNAQVYETNTRPVPLASFIVFQGKVYVEQDFLEQQPPLRELNASQEDAVVASLCQETLNEQCGVLVFCSSKEQCSRLAMSLKRQLDLPMMDNASLISDLKKCPAGLDPTLAELIPFGIAYHHAGLTAEERHCLEMAFRLGQLLILVATSTLASGVNLPARRVIFRSPQMGRQLLSRGAYQQMQGRAGRLGYDSLGESFLLVPDRLTFQKIMNTSTNDSDWDLEMCQQSLERVLLELIALQSVQSTEQGISFLEETLFYHSLQKDNLFQIAQSAMSYLKKHEFIRWQSQSNCYEATPLGLATVHASLSPQESLQMYQELAAAQRHFVLEPSFHLIYLCTPTYVPVVPPWAHFDRLFQRLPDALKRVADAIGIQEAYLMEAAQGRCQMSTPRQRQLFSMHCRFYAALLLDARANSVPLTQVADYYACPRGTVQQLQSTCSQFASMTCLFCRRLGWTGLARVLETWPMRMQFGVGEELLDLMSIEGMTVARARLLLDAGLESQMKLKQVSLKQLTLLFIKAIPFERDCDSVGERRLYVHFVEQEEQAAQNIYKWLQERNEKEVPPKIRFMIALLLVALFILAPVQVLSAKPSPPALLIHLINDKNVNDERLKVLDLNLTSYYGDRVFVNVNNGSDFYRSIKAANETGSNRSMNAFLSIKSCLMALKKSRKSCIFDVLTDDTSVNEAEKVTAVTLDDINQNIENITKTDSRKNANSRIPVLTNLYRRPLSSNSAITPASSINVGNNNAINANSEPLPAFKNNNTRNNQNTPNTIKSKTPPQIAAPNSGRTKSLVAEQIKFKNGNNTSNCQTLAPSSGVTTMNVETDSVTQIGYSNPKNVGQASTSSVSEIPNNPNPFPDNTLVPVNTPSSTVPVDTPTSTVPVHTPTSTPSTRIPDPLHSPTPTMLSSSNPVDQNDESDISFLQTQKGIIILASSLSAVVLIAVFITSYCCCRRQRRVHKSRAAIAALNRRRGFAKPQFSQRDEKSNEPLSTYEKVFGTKHLIPIAV